MRVVKAILTMTMMLVCCAPAMRAQTETAKTTSATPARSYRLLWTITDSDAGRVVGTQHFAMVVMTGVQTRMKLGSKVPVVTGSYSGSSAAGVQTQFQYLDVGLNINAMLDELPTGLKLSSDVEQSSVTEDKDISNVHEPVVRQAVLQSSSLLTLDKPVILGSLDIPGSAQHLDVEVVAERVK